MINILKWTKESGYHDVVAKLIERIEETQYGNKCLLFYAVNQLYEHINHII